MLQINIGKGLTMDVDESRLNDEARTHVMKIGLRNLLMDAHSSATAKADPENYIAKSRELAERKLQNLYNGVVRVATIGGPKTATDPVSQVILRLARRVIQKENDTELAAASKKDRLALLNKLAAEYAAANDSELRPRASQIVALESDEPAPVAKPAPVAAKSKRKAA